MSIEQERRWIKQRQQAILIVQRQQENAHQQSASTKLYQHSIYPRPEDRLLDRAAIKAGHGISNVAGTIAAFVLFSLSIGAVAEVVRWFA